MLMGFAKLKMQPSLVIVIKLSLKLLTQDTDRKGFKQF